MDFFQYLPAYRLLVCRDCQTCCTLGRVRGHLRGAPHSLPSDRITSLMADLEALYDVLSDDSELDSFVLPDKVPVIPELLSPISGGFRCTEQADCTFVGKEQRRIQEHLRAEHGRDIKIKPGKKRPFSEDPQYPWRTGVYLQRFFTRGTKSQYFEVIPEDPAGEVVVRRRQGAQAAAASFRERVRLIRQKELEGAGETSLFTATEPWLFRLGSPAHLADFGDRKEFLRSLISTKLQPADFDGADPAFRDDDLLVYVHKAVTSARNEARSLVRATKVSWAALFEVNRKEYGKDRSRPFHFQKRVATEKRYLEVVLQFFSYVVRTAAVISPEDRPPFVMSRGLTASLRNMLNLARNYQEIFEGDNEGLQYMVDEAYTKLKRGVVEFLIDVITEDGHQTEYSSVLVSFVAVLSINADHTWATTAEFTPKLSAIATMSRLFAVKAAVDRNDEEVNRLTLAGVPQEDALREAKGYFAAVRAIMLRGFVQAPTDNWKAPLFWLFGLRNYAFGTTRNMSGTALCTWDGDHVSFRTVRISVADIHQVLAQTILEAETILFRDLLLCTGYTDQRPSDVGVPTIPWGRIVDKRDDLSPATSLATCLHTASATTSEDWLLERIFRDDTYRRQFFPGDGANADDMNKKRLLIYAKHMDKFLEKLLFLVHFSYGQPARGPELLSIRYRNGVDNGMRNIFVDSGLIMIVTTYHKGITTTQTQKLIHRFLPREVGSLLAYYIWLVLPFWDGVLATMGAKELSPWLWESKPEEALDEEKEEVEEIGEAPEPSMLEKLRRAGPGPNWSSVRASRIFARATGAGCGQEVNISTWRHLAIVIGRKYILDEDSPGVAADFSDSEGSDSDHDDDTPFDLQSGHTSRTAGLIYGKMAGTLFAEFAGRRQEFRLISEDWHRLFGFPSARKPAGLGRRAKKRKIDRAHDATIREAKAYRRKVLASVDPLRALRKVMGDEAKFRGIQEKAINRVLRGDSPILVVMGTGSGKSLLFMLPAYCCPAGVTVVVVPLLSLQGDLVQRCVDIGISAAEWKTDRLPFGKALVFVTPELAMTTRFRGYLDNLHAAALLDRIVVDECHTILEGTPKFRPVLRELGQLTAVGVQMVYLTATLPPTAEDQFFELIYTLRKECTYLRVPTTRPNIKYSLVQYPEDDEAAAIRAVVDPLLEKYPAPAKVVVYCTAVDQVNGISNALGMRAFHAKVATVEGKSAIVRAWRSGVTDPTKYGGGRVICATSALGLGIDVPDIRAVVNVGMSFSVADFAQQSGRAGRDSAESESILLVRRTQKLPMTLPLGHTFTKNDFLIRGLCRRILLDSVMDGVADREGCDVDKELRCDYCDSVAGRESEGDDEDCRSRTSDQAADDTDIWDGVPADQPAGWVDVGDEVAPTRPAGDADTGGETAADQAAAGYDFTVEVPATLPAGDTDVGDGVAADQPATAAEQADDGWVVCDSYDPSTRVASDAEERHRKIREKARVRESRRHKAEQESPAIPTSHPVSTPGHTVSLRGRLQRESPAPLPEPSLPLPIQSSQQNTASQLSQVRMMLWGDTQESDDEGRMPLIGRPKPPRTARMDAISGSERAVTAGKDGQDKEKSPNTDKKARAALRASHTVSTPEQTVLVGGRQQQKSQTPITQRSQPSKATGPATADQDTSACRARKHPSTSGHTPGLGKRSRRTSQSLRVDSSQSQGLGRDATRPVVVSSSDEEDKVQHAAILGHRKRRKADQPAPAQPRVALPPGANQQRSARAKEPSSSAAMTHLGERLLQKSQSPQVGSSQGRRLSRQDRDAMMREMEAKAYSEDERKHAALLKFQERRKADQPTQPKESDQPGAEQQSAARANEPTSFADLNSTPAGLDRSTGASHTPPEEPATSARPTKRKKRQSAKIKAYEEHQIQRREQAIQNERARQRMAAATADPGADMVDFRAALDAERGVGCHACRITWYPTGLGFTPFDCVVTRCYQGETASADDQIKRHLRMTSSLRKLCNEMEKNIRRPFAEFGYCYRCYQPQAFCESWELQDDGGYKLRLPAAPCVEAGVLISAFLAYTKYILDPGEVRCVLATLGFSKDYQQAPFVELTHWLSTRVTFGGVQTCNLVRAFVELRKQHYEKIQAFWTKRGVNRYI